MAGDGVRPPGIRGPGTGTSGMLSWNGEDGRARRNVVTTLRVDGYPPAKSEAESLLSPRHPHRDRVVELLRSAHDALLSGDAEDFGHSPLVMRVELRCKRDRLSSRRTWRSVERWEADASAL